MDNDNNNTVREREREREGGGEWWGSSSTQRLGVGLNESVL